jgi:hypothetical protein
MFIAQIVHTTRVRTSYKTVRLTSSNEYLHNDISVTEVNLYVSVNNGIEKLFTKTMRLLVSKLSQLMLRTVTFIGN